MPALETRTEHETGGRGKSKSGIDAALDICRPGSL